MITILCSGSRGDYQPYIALAVELKKQGKSVRITGMRDFCALVESYGVEFYPIQADFKSLNVDEQMLKQAQSADNPLKMLLTFNKMKKYGISLAHEFYAACENSEMIIYHPGMTMGYFAAKELGVPAVLASPFPIHKTMERPSVLRYGRIRTSPNKNLFSYSLLQGMLWLASKDSVRGFWEKRFGRNPANFGKPYERHIVKQQPAIISCSNFVFSRPSDWNKHIYQFGYWFADEPESFIPEEELIQFLQAGEKPVYFGFGSVFHAEQKDRLVKIIIEALVKTGRRGIICSMGEFSNLPDTLYAIDSIPHSWLFERISAVCHHGGAGTTASGFKAGVPSIIIPFANDQHAWAYRAFDLGVGSKPLSIKKLNSADLAAAIMFSHQKKIVENARVLGENLASEQGARDCAAVVIDSFVE